MEPGKHPKYEIVTDETAPLKHEIVIKLPEGETVKGESVYGLCASESKGFLEGTLSDLENSIIDFEELSEQWAMDPEWRQAIIDSIQ